MGTNDGPTKPNTRKERKESAGMVIKYKTTKERKNCNKNRSRSGALERSHLACEMMLFGEFITDNGQRCVCPEWLYLADDERTLAGHFSQDLCKLVLVVCYDASKHNIQGQDSPI